MKLQYYIIGIVIILIDQLSKDIMIGRKMIIIPNFLEFNYLENTRGAFGIGETTLILILSIIIIAVMIFLLIKKKELINNYIPIILIISGSIGNLIDRIFRGYVIGIKNPGRTHYITECLFLCLL